MFQGCGNSLGVAVGYAHIVRNRSISIEKQTVCDAEQEVRRLDEAIGIACTQMEALLLEAEASLSSDEADIFEMHLALLEDPGYLGKVRERIRTEQANAEWALMEETSRLVTSFGEKGDMLKQRTADLREIELRLSDILLDQQPQATKMLQENSILIGDELLPSQILKLDVTKTKGVATSGGGATSHAAILAKAQGIPAVFGAQGLLEQITDGDYVIVDADTGTIYINPTNDVLLAYQKKVAEQAQLSEFAKAYRTAQAATTDGKRILVEGNIAGPMGTASVLAAGADGVGLFRTEFLYLERDTLPAEEEQFAFYLKAVRGMQGLPLVIRTLDIGGDKQVCSLGLNQEANPFLGYRAIRICLDQEPVFRTQLRAILRASAFGPISIMFPMISCVEELRQAKAILSGVREELLHEQIPFDTNVPVGIMVETPAAAMLSDLLAREVDFFSIGTNDLIQYTAAVDRMNGRIAHLASPYHPGVLRLIANIVSGAAKQSIPVAVCGEMAGEFPLIPLLIGLGVDALSMSASLITKAKYIVCNTPFHQAQGLAQRALSLSTVQELREAVSLFHETLIPPA